MPLPVLAHIEAPLNSRDAQQIQGNFDTIEAAVLTAGDVHTGTAPLLYNIVTEEPSSTGEIAFYNTVTSAYADGWDDLADVDEVHVNKRDLDATSSDSNQNSGWFSALTNGALIAFSYAGGRFLFQTDSAGANNDPATGLYNFSGDERITKAGTAWPSDEDVVGVSFAVIGQGTGSPGAAGDDGPSPVFSVHSNGSRRVLQLEGYSDPTTPTTVSDAPTTPTYVGVSGFTTTLADAVDLRGPGLQRGEVWATITIPAIAAPSSEWLNISTVTKEADAPAQLTVHSGTQRNIRISPNWDPPSGMYGWHIVPFIDSTEYPGRCFVPLGSFTNCFP